MATVRTEAQHSGLVWTLVRTDFKARYHGSMAGFFWALLKPFSMFAVLMAVFSFLFTADKNYTLNLVIGLFLWEFFAESTRTGVVSLYSKGYLLTKAHFPPWIAVVTSTSNAVITLVVFIIVILIFISGARGVPPVTSIILFIWYLVQLYVIVTGFSLAASLLFLRYRDLNQIWDLLLQAGFFVTPIIYPMRILPVRFHLFLYVSPVTPIVQFSRAVLVDGTVPSLKGHLLLLGLTVFSLLVGLVTYWRLAPSASERA